MRLRRHKKTVDTESTKALAEAQESLERVRARTPEVLVVAHSLRNIRERNHFAETFKNILEGVRDA